MAARIAIPPELIAFMRSAENLGLLARRRQLVERWPLVAAPGAADAMI
jgi:hypothetical protein